jgi:hypothetical protein
MEAMLFVLQEGHFLGFREYSYRIISPSINFVTDEVAIFLLM